MLFHLLKISATLSPREKADVIVTLANTGHYCGGRYMTEVRELYNRFCKKERTNPAELLYQRLTEIRQTGLYAMEADTHVRQDVEYLLAPFLGTSTLAIMDPIGHLVRMRDSDILEYREKKLRQFLNWYTPATITSAVTDQIKAEAAIREVYQNLATHYLKSSYRLTPELSELSAKILASEDEALVLLFSLVKVEEGKEEEKKDSFKTLKAKTSELHKIISEEGAKVGIYRRATETARRAILDAEQLEMENEFLFCDELHTTPSPYALLRLLVKLNILQVGESA